MRGRGDNLLLRHVPVVLCGRDGGFHQFAGFVHNFDGALGENYGLQLLDLDDGLIGGKESLDDGFHRVDPAVKFLVAGFLPRGLQRVRERSFGNRNLPQHFDVTGSSKPPDRGQHDVEARIRLKQQLFDIRPVRQALQH